MAHHAYIERSLTPCRKSRKISPNVRQQQRRPTLEALRRARADAGLTISELAKRAGVSRDTVSNAERGLHSLQATTLHKVAHALGKAPSELLAEEERLTPKVRGSSLEPSLLDRLEGEQTTAEAVSPEQWRSQLDLLEMCVQYTISRAESYEGELERGRFSDYETARGTSNLAVLALQEFANFTKWVFDEPVRPLAVALEQVPSNVDPRIAGEFEAKEDVMRARAKETTDLLFKHAEELAETAEERKKLANRRQAKERAAYGETRIA